MFLTLKFARKNANHNKMMDVTASFARFNEVFFVAQSSLPTYERIMWPTKTTILWVGPKHSVTVDHESS